MLPEPESEALLRAVAEWPERSSSDVATVEVPRAVRREREEPALLEQAERVLAGLALVYLDLEIARVAARLAPRRLRTLDAIHLATALSLGEELGAFVCYDERLAGAALAAEAPLLAPGR